VFTSAIIIWSVRLFTNSIEQCHSWKANRYSINPEIPRKLWNPKVHYRIQNSPPRVPNLSQKSPVHVSHPTFWRRVLILSSHLPLCLLSGLLLSRFPNKIFYATIFPTVRATCPDHLIPLDMLNWIKFGEDYRPSSSSLCSLPHSPVTSTSQIFSSAPYSRVTSVYVPPFIRTSR